MNRLAALIDRLAVAPDADVKRRMLAEYFADAQESDRAIVATLLSAKPKQRHVTLALIRGLAETRLDPILFALSLEFVGDMAETIALLWPQRHGANKDPSPSEVYEALSTLGRSELPKRIEAWLDACDANGRWALIKLLTGTLGAAATASEVNGALLAAGIDTLTTETRETPQQPQEDLFGKPLQIVTPGTLDAVLMYVSSGRSKSSPLICTFGAWKDDTLVPIGKAEAESVREVIANFVASNTINRFGPVREVAHARDTGLVLTIAFEGVRQSLRQKSGIALLGAQIIKAHPGKAPSDAGDIGTLESLLPRG
ncbi:MAG: hypothetical protein K8S25_11260 [Alphaproteobacteria bacterium]|nr:hypothetical protein [Alphaproteobacteria bacterium]